ncbi:MAG: hypothetical protein L0Z53_11805 [Acidobacteriales bacterium]|nr:hypothetical protein [Terriglobales bacterium]
MLGSLNDFIWFSGVAAALFVVIRSVVRREFFRYFPLNFYMLSLALASLGRRLFLILYGVKSPEYTYFYYYSDTLLTIVLYFAILSLYQCVFAEMKVSRYIRVGGAALLGLTAAVSYMMVHQNTQNMTKPFVVELSQNLYFVGVVLTYVLWGAVAQLRETRTRIVQLVLSLGVFFSAHAALYAAWHLFPSAVVWVPGVIPVLGIALPVSWAYTFTMVPEEARIETARVAPSRVAASHQ